MAPVTTGGLAEVLPVLQAGYVDYAALQVQPADQLTDIVSRSQGKISITAPTAVSEPPPPTVATLLPGEVVYCRFASFHPAAGWADFASQLKAWAAQGAQGLILDLRSTATPDDFAGAADVAGLFTPPGTPLFTLRKAGAGAHAYLSACPAVGFNPPLINGPIAVLINGGTAGAAEALAAFFKADGALTLGRWTSGNGAEFAEHTLASGQVLHYLAGQVTMPDGTSLWRQAVEPDIGLLTDPQKEAVVLGLIQQNKIADVIRESAGSHRLSEAALVRGEEPALEAYLVPHDKPVLATAPQDSVLVAALDSLKAILVSEEAPANAGSIDPKIPSIVQ